MIFFLGKTQQQRQREAFVDKMTVQVPFRIMPFVFLCLVLVDSVQDVIDLMKSGKARPRRQMVKVRVTHF